MLSMNKDLVHPEVHKMHLQRGISSLQDAVGLGAARKIEVKQENLIQNIEALKVFKNRVGRHLSGLIKADLDLGQKNGETDQ